MTESERAAHYRQSAGSAPFTGARQGPEPRGAALPAKQESAGSRPATAKKRVRFIHNYFHPDLSSVSQIVSDIAAFLAAEGHDVSVIASKNLYDGSSASSLPSRESVMGVSVRRIWAPSLGRRTLLTRVLDQGAYMTGATLRALFAPRADTVVMLTNPPMFGALGILLRRIRGERFVHIVMDLYPDVAIRSGLLPPDSWISQLLRRVTRRTLREADRVVVLGRCMRDQILAYGVDAERIELIRNWADEDALAPASRENNPLRVALGWGDRPVVMYSGNMGVAHRFDDILEVARRLEGRSNVLFAFVGDGVRREEVARFRDAHGLNNVVLLPYQEQEKLGESLGAADVHFVSLRTGFEGLVVPSKSYGIMAAARPLIYQGSERGEIAQMILEHGIGLVVPEEAVDALEQAVLKLTRDRELSVDLGRKARDVLLSGYSREQSLARYRRLLTEAEA